MASAFTCNPFTRKPASTTCANTPGHGASKLHAVHLQCRLELMAAYRHDLTQQVSLLFVRKPVGDHSAAYMSAGVIMNLVKP